MKRMVSRSVGSSHTSSRLSDRIPGDTQVSGSKNKSSSPGFYKEKILIRQGRQVISQVSYRRSERKFPGGFLFDYIFSTKEERHLGAGNKSQAVESVYQKVQIQNDNVEADNTGSMTWGLDAVNRLERCLFPCANMSRTGNS